MSRRSISMARRPVRSPMRTVARSLRRAVGTGSRSGIARSCVVVWLAVLLVAAGCDGDAATPRHVCGATACPNLAGYQVACNEASHCELSRVEATEDWHADDVWIFVPAGSFAMGSPDGPDVTPAEQPVRTVTIAAGYLIQKYPLTVRTHEACERAGVCGEPRIDFVLWPRHELNRSDDGRGDHPQNGMDWFMARELCVWLDGRLPTEAEWELAAKGPDVHRRYPWGDAPEPDCDAGLAVFNRLDNHRDGTGCGTNETFPVRSQFAGASPVGALHMVGNVDEMVLDCWHPSFDGGPTDGSAWTDRCFGEPFSIVVRGGSMESPPRHVRTTWRRSYAPGRGSTGVGARCVREVP